jgi:hypothetical protein
MLLFVDGDCNHHMGEERKVYKVLVGKPKKETTWKTKA